MMLSQENRSMLALALILIFFVFAFFTLFQPFRRPWPGPGPLPQYETEGGVPFRAPPDEPPVAPDEPFPIHRIRP